MAQITPSWGVFTHAKCTVLIWWEEHSRFLHALLAASSALNSPATVPVHFQGVSEHVETCGAPPVHTAKLPSGFPGRIASKSCREIPSKSARERGFKIFFQGHLPVWSKGLEARATKFLAALLLQR